MNYKLENMTIYSGDYGVWLRKWAEREQNAGKEHYVYFISDEHERVKIGITNNVNERLRYLQNGNADLLKISKVIAVPNREAAFSLERDMQELFWRARLRGEWYDARMVEKTMENWTI